MILSKQGEIHVEGCRPEVMADFTVMANVLMEKDIMTAEELHAAIERAKKTEEKLTEELAEELVNMVKKLF